MGCVIGAVFCALLTSSLFGASGGAVAATASSLIGVVVSLKTSDTSWVITSCMRCLRSWMKQRLLHKSTRGSSAPALSMKSTLLSLTLCILSPHAFVILAAPLDQTQIFQPSCIFPFSTIFSQVYIVYLETCLYMVTREVVFLH